MQFEWAEILGLVYSAIKVLLIVALVVVAGVEGLRFRRQQMQKRNAASEEGSAEEGRRDDERDQE